MQSLRARESEEQRPVEWLHESRVHDCRFDSIFREASAAASGRMDHRAVGNDRGLTTVAQYLRFADLEQFRLTIDRTPMPLPRGYRIAAGPACSSIVNSMSRISPSSFGAIRTMFGTPRR